MSDKTGRQRELANWIGAQIYRGSPLLVPLGRHSSFSPPPMPLDDNYLDARLCDAAWWAVASILGDIDHAWLFGWPDGTKEPWGFVTEPYLSEDQAQSIVGKADLMMTGWGVEFIVLPKAQSTWNPNQCVPIVAHFESGMMRPLIRNATAWMLR
jgi:hypothetical protein